MDKAPLGDRRVLRVGASSYTWLMLAFGVILLTLIPAVLFLVPPTSDVVSPGEACRFIGLIGIVMILAGVLKMSTTLELDGSILRYRRFLSKHQIDIRNATHVFESSARIRGYRSSGTILQSLHFCRIQGPGNEIPTWLSLGRSDESVVLGDFIKQFEASAPEHGVQVLMSVIGYSGYRSEDSPFKDSDLLALFTEMKRISPELTVDPRIYKRLGGIEQAGPLL